MRPGLPGAFLVRQSCHVRAADSLAHLQRSALPCPARWPLVVMFVNVDQVPRIFVPHPPEGVRATRVPEFVAFLSDIVANQPRGKEIT